MVTKVYCLKYPDVNDTLCYKGMSNLYAKEKLIFKSIDVKIENVLG